jgi:hypothetical protein
MLAVLCVLVSVNATAETNWNGANQNLWYLALLEEQIQGEARYISHSAGYDG